MDGLTSEEGRPKPDSLFERERRAVSESRTLSVLNQAAAICLAIGVFYLFYGIAITATDASTLGVNTGLGVAIDWFGKMPIAVGLIAVGLAMILAVKKQSRLKVALITAILVSIFWTGMSCVPSWLGITPGISPPGIALWAAFGSLAAYSLLRVARIDRTYADLWVN